MSFLSNLKKWKVPTTNAAGTALVVGGREHYFSGSTGRGALLIGHSYMDVESGEFSGRRPLTYILGTFTWANTLLGKPFHTSYSFGIGGERVSDVLSRMSYLGERTFDIAVMSIGLNDLKNTYNSTFNSRVTGLPYPADPNQINLQYVCAGAAELIQQTLQHSAFVFVLGESAPAGGTNKILATRISQYNRYLRALCAKQNRCIYVPVDVLMHNPLAVDASINPNVYMDSVHPSAYGAYLRGKMLADRIAAHIPVIYGESLPTNIFETFNNLKITATSLTSIDGAMTVVLDNSEAGSSAIRPGDMCIVAIPDAAGVNYSGRYLVSASNTTSIELITPGVVNGTYTGTIYCSTTKQIFDNPLYATATGGTSSGGIVVSGNIPLHVNISGPATCSVTVTTPVHTDTDGVADGFGNWLDLDFTLAANAEVYVNNYFSTHGQYLTSPYYGRLNPGDIVSSCADIDVIASSNINRLQWHLHNFLAETKTGVASEYASVIDHYHDTALGSANMPWRGVLATENYLLPDNKWPGNNNASLYIKAGTSASTLHIRIGRVGVFLVDNPLRNMNDVFAV